jgi:hypothetical protein
VRSHRCGNNKREFCDLQKGISFASAEALQNSIPLIIHLSVYVSVSDFQNNKREFCDLQKGISFASAEALQNCIPLIIHWSIC